ncbi:hypothetical protein [Mesobacillus zeae]|uniref:hypothetical protein n=1 Tax=Mesobacillus zeae TaxID=1917180 RepID=UPI0015E7151B|nr:hypothetical protein [Mesobacillus zeae]
MSILVGVLSLLFMCCSILILTYMAATLKVKKDHRNEDKGAYSYLFDVYGD